MELLFDYRGNLKPYDKIQVESNYFETFFVTNFSQSVTRKLIFEDYKDYITHFCKKVTPNFTHWINGSFVTNKLNPNDIDFLIFLDYELFIDKKEAINTFFATNENRQNKRLDVFFLIQFPENHKDAFKSISDEAYWYDWFTKTATNRKQQRHSKGFVEIKL